jgi:hypothetical protein
VTDSSDSGTGDDDDDDGDDDDDCEDSDDAQRKESEELGYREAKLMRSGRLSPARLGLNLCLVVTVCT